jgi:hypothetical protein
MPLPTPPSGVSVSAYTASSVTLSWTAGTVDHYDVYRAPMTSTGRFGPFAKINSSSVSSAATSYVDNSTNSTSAPTGNTPYCWIVYGVAADSSQLAANPVFGTAFDGTDIVGVIRDGLKTQILATLVSEDSGWTASKYDLDVERNSSETRDKSFSLIVKPGSRMAGPQRAMDISKGFQLRLYRKIIRKDGGDGDFLDRVDELSNLTEIVMVELLKTNSNLGSQVIMIRREPEPEIEVSADGNLLIMGVDFNVHYRISL